MLNQLQQKLGEVQENEPLANHTTFKIGGPAQFFYLAKNSEDLLKAVKAAEELKIPYFVLGWGSNLLVSDNGFKGLVIKVFNNNYEIRGEEIWAESGFNLSRLVGVAGQAGLSGLGPMAGIPGTVGGAAFGNAGAYGVSFGTLVKEVEVYQDCVVKKLDQSQMQYSYRQSVLKSQPGIILSVTVKLKPGDGKEIRDKVVGILMERKQKLPAEPSAGCVFKNIKLSDVKIDEEKVIKELDITNEEWQKATGFGKLTVGFILDRLNLKGKVIGGCKVSDKHSAFFINTGGAKAEHVIMLISDIKMRVRNQLGIQLEEEIRYLGF